MVMIYAESGPEDLASLVPCFKMEGTGYRNAAFTLPLAEAVRVTEVDGFGSRRKTAEISESISVD
jgi:hypothetical protein